MCSQPPPGECAAVMRRAAAVSRLHAHRFLTDDLPDGIPDEDAHKFGNLIDMNNIIPPLDGIFHNIVCAIFCDIMRYYAIFCDLLRYLLAPLRGKILGFRATTSQNP